MAQKRLVYIWSLRNAAADKAGQHINYKAEARYMPSPLEHLVTLLNEGPLGEHLVLDRVIFNDNEGSPATGPSWPTTASRLGPGGRGSTLRG